MQNKKLRQGYKFVTLSDYCEKITSGGTPNRSNSSYYNGDILWIKSGELNDNYLYDSQEKITMTGLNNSSAKIFPENTLLIAMYGATIGKTAILKVEASTNQAVCAIIPTKSFDTYYLQQYFIFKRPKLLSFGMGAGQPNISQDIIKKFRIPFLTIQEQKKIASILSNLDELINSYNQIIDFTKTLKIGLTQKLLLKGLGHKKFKKIKWMFGKELEIPVDYNIQRVEYLIKNKNDLKTGPFGSTLKKDTFVSKGYKVYGQENVIPDDFSVGNYFITKEHFEKMKEYELKPDDILISLVGTHGKISIVPENIQPGIINPRLLRIRFDKSKAIPQFMKILLESNIVKSQIKKLVHGLTMEIMNTAILRKILFPIPPVVEQQEIAVILSNMHLLIEKERKFKSQLENIKKGLMQKLLTGQIRV